MKRDLLDRIDRAQARARSNGQDLTDSRALSIIMLRHYEQAFIRQGKTQLDARRLAKAIVAGPEFRSRKVDISRWRDEFNRPKSPKKTQA